MQVTMALTGTLRVRAQGHAEALTCDALLIPSDVMHEIDARGAFVLIAYVNPESDLPIPGLDETGSGVQPFSDVVVARWREALGSCQTLNSQRVHLWMTRELSDGCRSRPIHAGVQRVLERLRADDLGRPQTSLTALAAVAGLSRSRLMHAFTESIGTPLRPYIRWLRVQRAICALYSGHTVTEAAHLAGFSDASHFARSLRRTLGATPRQLLPRVATPNDPGAPRLDESCGCLSQFVQDSDAPTRYDQRTSIARR
ncbi:MAG TPA: helix-turn-helix domain-containing protein [Vicinamibacterales bacterium]|nr:helix-turn-helix domain-containing protein [Vicinamibacterales bacterium]